MTEEDKKLIYDWCGFKRSRATVLGEPKWVYPEGKYFLALPPLDLNFYFKYAVPKLGEMGLRLRMLGQIKNGKGYFCSIGGTLLAHQYAEAKGPAEAFGQALLKLIKEK